MLIVFFLVVSFFLILLISFFLAVRALSQLKIPNDVLVKLQKGQKPPRFWGVIIFAKKKILHYSSSALNSADSSSSINSANNSERNELL